MSENITYSPVTPKATSTTGTPSNAAARTATNAVDKDMFLKLMMAQVSHQDPMQPTDSTQWLAQMAQFSTVEQLTNMAQTSSSAAGDAQMTNAVGLIGRTVTYDGGNAPVQGKVESVQVGQSGPTLTIDGVSGISPSKLSDVR